MGDRGAALVGLTAALVAMGAVLVAIPPSFLPWAPPQQPSRQPGGMAQQQPAVTTTGPRRGPVLDTSLTAVEAVSPTLDSTMDPVQVAGLRKPVLLRGWSRFSFFLSRVPLSLR